MRFGTREPVGKITFTQKKSLTGGLLRGQLTGVRGVRVANVNPLPEPVNLTWRQVKGPIYRFG